MANKQESALDAITSLGSTFVRMISSGGESVKATIANVAKYIIETYASSSLAGSNQSVKSAIDSLNSNIEGGPISSGDLNNYTNPKAIRIDNNVGNISNCPITWGVVVVINPSGPTIYNYYGAQIAISTGGAVYVRSFTKNAGFTVWKSVQLS